MPGGAGLEGWGERGGLGGARRLERGGRSGLAMAGREVCAETGGPGEANCGPRDLSPRCVAQHLIDCLTLHHAAQCRITRDVILYQHGTKQHFPAQNLIPFRAASHHCTASHFLRRINRTAPTAQLHSTPCRTTPRRTAPHHTASNNAMPLLTTLNSCTPRHTDLAAPHLSETRFAPLCAASLQNKLCYANATPGDKADGN